MYLFWVLLDSEAGDYNLKSFEKYFFLLNYWDCFQLELYCYGVIDLVNYSLMINLLR